MKTSFKYLVITLLFGLIACEDENVYKSSGSYIEYLSDKSIIAIRIYNQSTWILSSKLCDTCYIAPYMSYIPTISQLTLIKDSSFKYDEPTNFSIPCSDSKGNLFTASNNKLYKINNINDYSIFLETGDFHFNEFIFDKNDNIWLSGYNGIAFWNGVELKIYNSNNSELPSDITHGLAIDNAGTIWVALDFKGLLKIKSDNWEIIPNSEISGLKDISYLRNPIVDNDNNLWFNVFSPDINSNILTYDGLDWEYQFPDQSKYSNLNIDSKGTIWAIINHYDNDNFVSSTLFYYRNNDWINFDVSNIKSKILTVNSDDSKVFIGTVKGLYIKER
jgi:hypothetical protein